MAIIAIKTDPSVDRKTSIVIGDQGRVVNASHTTPIEAEPQSSRYHGVVSKVASSAGKLVIGATTQSFEEETYKRWNWSVLAQLADLVDKGLVLVTLDGVAQTSADIRTAHVAT